MVALVYVGTFRVDMRTEAFPFAGKIFFSKPTRALIWLQSNRFWFTQRDARRFR